MAKKKSTVPGGGVKVDRKAIVAVVVSVALCAGAWFAFTGPQRSTHTKVAAELASAQRTLDGHEAELAALRAGGATQAQQLLGQAQQLDAMLPMSAERVALVAEVDQLARGNGLTMEQMNPGAVVNSTGRLAADTFDVRVTGSSSGVTSFLGVLGTRAPLMTIAKLTTSVEDRDGQQMTNASFTLHVWFVDKPTLAGTAPADVTGQPGTTGVTDPNAATGTHSGSLNGTGQTSSGGVTGAAPGNG